MTNEPFDPYEYIRIPVITVAAGYSLACSLISASPKGLPVTPRKALTRVRSDTLALRESWLQRSLSTGPEKRQPADAALDSIWGAIFTRVDSYTLLPADRYPDATVALQLRTTLFSNGLGFLRLPYEQEWAESERLLALLETSGQTEDLRRIAGKDFVDQLHHSHRDYGRVLGITEPVAESNEVTVGARLRALRSSMGSYALKMVAIIEDEDPSTTEMVRNALRPIAALRAVQAKRGASSNTPPSEPTDPIEPDAPVPELPPAVES